MKIKRVNPRKRMNAFALGCGCLAGVGMIGVVVIGIFVAFVWPAMPGAFLQSAGFERVGNTKDIFADTHQSRPVLDTVQEEPVTIVVQGGGIGQQTINNSDVSEIQVGTINGESTLQMTFSESDLLGLCQQYSAICGAGDSTIRNVRFDLRPGGMIVYADFYVQQVNIWQPVGVVMRLTDNNQLVVSGVDMNGQLYAAPPNEIGSMITEVETVANELLRQLTVQASGATYTLDSIYIDDQSLVATMR